MPLTLTRRLGETIIVGDGHSMPVVLITVTRIDGDKVRITIDAPRDVEIWRPECLPPDDPRRDNVPKS